MTEEKDNDKIRSAMEFGSTLTSSSYEEPEMNQKKSYEDYSTDEEAWSSPSKKSDNQNEGMAHQNFKRKQDASNSRFPKSIDDRKQGVIFSFEPSRPHLGSDQSNKQNNPFGLSTIAGFTISPSSETSARKRVDSAGSGALSSLDESSDHSFSKPNQPVVGQTLETINKLSTGGSPLPSIRKRVDSTGSNGKGHFQRNVKTTFYDSDTSHGSVVFQRKGGPSGFSNFHFRQQSDISVLSTFTIDHPETQLPSAVDENAKKIKKNDGTGASVNAFPNLPYHERVMLRNSFQSQSSNLESRKSLGSSSRLRIDSKDSTHSQEKDVKIDGKRVIKSSRSSSKPSRQKPKQNNVTAERGVNNNNVGNAFAVGRPQKIEPNFKMPQPSTSKNKPPIGNYASMNKFGEGDRRHDLLSPGRQQQPNVKKVEAASRLVRPPKIENRDTSTGSTLSTLTSMQPHGPYSSRSRCDSLDSNVSINSRDSFNNGNSFVLNKLSDKLAKDVVQFFKGEKDDDDNTAADDKSKNAVRKYSLEQIRYGKEETPIKTNTTAAKSKREKQSTGYGTLEDSKRDYHQQNQDFLNRAKRVMQEQLHHQQQFQLYQHQHHQFSYNNPYIQSMQPKSPANQFPNPSMSPTTGRPAHRPYLKSIDNDDWEEDKFEETERTGSSEFFKEKSKSINQDNYQTSLDVYAKGRKESGQSAPTQDYVSSSNSDGIVGHRNEPSFQLTVSSKEELYETDTKTSGDDVPISQDHRSKHRGGKDGSGTFVFLSDNEDKGAISSSTSASSNLDTSESDTSFDAQGDIHASERTSLLLPTGLSSHEKGSASTQLNSPAREKEKRAMREHIRAKKKLKQLESEKRKQEIKRLKAIEQRMKDKERKNKYNKKKERKLYRKKKVEISSSELDELSSSDTSAYRKQKKLMNIILKQEREKLVTQWKEEYRRELIEMRKFEEEHRWYNRLGRFVMSKMGEIYKKIVKNQSLIVTFISNLPFTIGGIAAAIATLGVVWFKFFEENLDSCQPVPFRSSQCLVHEFPGCFRCDTSSYWYNFALYFHYACNMFAGLLVLSFVLKFVLATQLVLDEMSSPTTSSPAGLICMTMVIVCAGRGSIGSTLVYVFSILHLVIVLWFIYMALAYRTLPDPSWWPNTVGIGISAAKAWLTHPNFGIFLMALCLIFNFTLFPLSIFRVTVNTKISAPVCWIQASAPSAALYALTLMAQPTLDVIRDEAKDGHFHALHRLVYLPCMHVMFFLSVLGAASSIQSLWVRWPQFRKKEFSPAHVAFCFPTLSHANAIQAYRGAIDAFSTITPGSWVKLLLFSYWVIVLVAGTLLTTILTTKFFIKLPGWVQVDVDDEEEPPAPNETMVSYVIGTGEAFRQPFVSPVVLQANETGLLVRRQNELNDGRGKYVRSRRISALGFEPTMNWSEMNEEREVLLDWVAKNPPRRRRNTLSVPGVDFNRYNLQEEFGTGNSGVYGSSRARANTTGVDQTRSYRSRMDGIL